MTKLQLRSLVKQVITETKKSLTENKEIDSRLNSQIYKLAMEAGEALGHSIEYHYAYEAELSPIFSDENVNLNLLFSNPYFKKDFVEGYKEGASKASQDI